MYDDAVCWGCIAITFRVHYMAFWVHCAQQFAITNRWKEPICSFHIFLHLVHSIFRNFRWIKLSTNIDIFQLRGPNFVQIYPNLNQLAHTFKSIFDTNSNQYIIPNLLFNWFYANQKRFKQTNSCTNWEWIQTFVKKSRLSEKKQPNLHAFSSRKFMPIAKIYMSFDFAILMKINLLSITNL